MYQIILEKQVQKFLEKHRGQQLVHQFQKALKFLTLSPYQNTLDIKRIVNLPYVYRLRIWEYRFIYEIIDQTIVIDFFYAGARGDVYNQLKKLQ